MFLPSIPNIKGVIDIIQEDTADKFFTTLQQDIQYQLEELHGGLSPTEKAEVMRVTPKEQNYVRVILATRIAETALTLDNIIYVLDSGLEREYYFDEIARLDYMEVKQISQSSAIQRQGRAGRVKPGFCFKMYTIEDETRMEVNKEAEILRTDISDLILYGYKLRDFFEINNLMYYQELSKQKVTKITQELINLNTLRYDEKVGSTVLTNKGEFVIQMGLKVLIACLLYESLKMGIEELGILAACSLKMGRGFFRRNEMLKKYADNELKLERSETGNSNLGDLAPLIHIAKSYERMNQSMKREFEIRYQITGKEMRGLYRTRDNILL